jgi:hypothetical protein
VTRVRLVNDAIGMSSIINDKIVVPSSLVAEPGAEPTGFTSERIPAFSGKPAEKRPNAAQGRFSQPPALPS